MEGVRKPRRAELLLGVSQEMAGTESLDQALAVLLGIVTDEIGADRGTIFLNDERTDELYSRVVIGNLTEEIRIPNDSGLVGHVFRTGEGVIVEDVYNDDRFNKDVDKKTGYVTKSIMSVPIKTEGGEIIGVAQVLNKKNGDFTEKDSKLLAAMTMKAAKVLRQAQFLERLSPPFVTWLRSIKASLFGGGG